VDTIPLPSVSEFANAEDRLDCATELPLEEYASRLKAWDAYRIEHPHAMRADFFDLVMLRCIYHAVVPVFEELTEKDFSEMLKRRFMRRLEEVRMYFFKS
jgi:hypothetical protein